MIIPNDIVKIITTWVQQNVSNYSALPPYNIIYCYQNNIKSLRKNKDLPFSLNNTIEQDITFF